MQKEINYERKGRNNKEMKDVRKEGRNKERQKE